MPRCREAYRSIEDGLVELDEILRERTATLKSDRERAKAAYDRARAQCGTVAAIDSRTIGAFARLTTDKLDNGDTKTCSKERSSPAEIGGFRVRR
jgi:hypothetical protein